jgi:type II secretory pathway component PulK
MKKRIEHRYQPCKSRWSSRRASPGRRALMLVVVLFMIALLSVLAASYAFLVNAHMSEVQMSHYRFQARMAAESGVQRAIVMLRQNPEDQDFSTDLNLWFDNEEVFQGGVVMGAEDRTEEGVDRTRKEENVSYDPEKDRIWRYNLVAPNYQEPDTLRYGVTDECARLDINLATETQLRLLFEAVIPDDEDYQVDINVLVDSLLDWREQGDTPRPNGAKDAYYQSLEPPYNCKKAQFATIEELLLVRDFTPWVMFGEDYNQNGLLDVNEDDGDESFPPDNDDNELFKGIVPYLTVWSRELNVSNTRAPRINLNLQDTEKLREDLEEDFDGAIVDYIMDVRAAGKQFNSVMNLLPAPPPPEEEQGSETESEPEVETEAAEQPEEGDTNSESGSENAEGEGEDSSDLDETETASENAEEESAVSATPTYANLTDEEPPGTLEDLPLILDRLTVDAVPGYSGRINVSTASREVLATIEELTEEEIDAIMQTRPEVPGEELATPAWLLTQGVLDETKFRMLLDGRDLAEPKAGGIITTKSSVYRAEAVGYADNLGVIERIQVVFEMRGPIAQVLYHRNLTPLGPAYSPHGIEKRERAEGRGAGGSD